MKRLAGVLPVLLFSCILFAQQTPQEKEVFKLEHDYWKFVQSNDLDSYRNLWHENFVGWPMSSAKPVHKDHITDWITAQTQQGFHLASSQLDEAASQAFGDVVITHYWITLVWAKDSGTSTQGKSRITHTWLRTAAGWKIIGGMSAPVAETRN